MRSPDKSRPDMRKRVETHDLGLRILRLCTRTICVTDQPRQPDYCITVHAICSS